MEGKPIEDQARPLRLSSFLLTFPPPLLLNIPASSVFSDEDGDHDDRIWVFHLAKRGRLTQGLKKR